MRGGGGQAVGGEAVAGPVLLFDVFHRQRHQQGAPAGALQPVDHQRDGRRHRDQRHDLAEAQPGVPDEQRVGAQALDPVAAQAVPDNIHQEQLAVEAAVPPVQPEHQQPEQAPEAFVQEGGVNRLGRVHRNALGGQGGLDAGQVVVGALAVHAPGQGGVGAEGFLIDKVAPAADALAHQEAHGHHVEEGQQRDPAPAGGQPAEDERADDAAVDGQAAVPHRDHIPDGLVLKGRHGHIGDAGADDAHDGADHHHVHQAVGVEAEVRRIVEGQRHAQDEPQGDEDAVPVDVEPAQRERHAVEGEFQAEARKLDMKNGSHGKFLPIAPQRCAAAPLVRRGAAQPCGWIST